MTQPTYRESSDANMAVLAEANGLTSNKTKAGLSPNRLTAKITLGGIWSEDEIELLEGKEEEQAKVISALILSNP